MDIFLVVIPFVAGIILKVAVFCVSGKAQRAALEKLEAGHKGKKDPDVLTEGQKLVVLAVVGLSTASIVGASTLITSLVTFLVVAVRYQHGWIWVFWSFDLVLSIVLWLYIRGCKEPYQQVCGLKVGTFILVLASFLDALALVPTMVALRANSTQNRPSQVALIVEAYAALKAPIFRGSADAGRDPSIQGEGESRSEQSQKQRMGVSAPREQKQVPHRAWRPVRNNRDLG